MRLPGALTAGAVVLGVSASAAGQTPPANPPPPAVEEQAPPPEAPPAEEYRPLLSYRFHGMEIAAPIHLAGRVEGVNGFPVDRDGNTFQNGPAISPLVRIGARFRTIEPLAGKFMILAEYEHDVPTGTWTKDKPIAGDGMPNSTAITTQIRKGWARFSVGPYFTIGGGLMTSHWGLGLVANDGAHGWEPGSARFSDPRGGDLVLRGFVGTGPITSARLTTAFAVEKVRSDDVLLSGDSAYQLIASVLIGHERPNQIGYFFVHRHQTAADNSFLDVNVADVAGKATFDLDRAKLVLEAEGALVFGKTTFGATVEVPRSDVVQLGGVVRASLAFEKAGGVLDLLYASGDSNTHDKHVNGFHADPNFETGLLLFRYVQAAQTARGVVTASNPQISAVPPPGVERLPSRGGMTDAVVIFPRFWVRPVSGLEGYGGVLFALAPAKNIDAFNTDIAGGSPRNALGANPGSYWGTEVDLGLRYRVNLRGTVLGAGAEGGVLFPGSALRGAPTPDFGPVYGGRLMLEYRL
jgi:hypothetical protein